MPSLSSAKREIAHFGSLLYERGMLAGIGGNISVRLSDGRIVITPSGLAKGRLSPDDMVVVDARGKPVQGSRQASSEMAIHLFVYQERAEIRACVHSHAPYATCFAVAGVNLADDILPEVVLFVGGVPLTDYAPPGTDAVPQALRPYVGKTNAFLLRNHGLLTIGRSLEEAHNRHETVEHYARIVYLARQLGNVDAIPPEDFKRLEEMRLKLDETWEGKL